MPFGHPAVSGPDFGNTVRNAPTCFIVPRDTNGVVSSSPLLPCLLRQRLPPSADAATEVSYTTGPRGMKKWP